MIPLGEKLFKSFYNEDSKEILILKNPTPEEWGKYVPEGARGYIDKSGNLFIEGLENKRIDKYSVTIHEFLLDALGFGEEYSKRFHRFYGKELETGICIVRYDKTNTIVVSESIHEDSFDVNNVKELFSRCYKKNPSLKFHPVNYQDFSAVMVGVRRR